MESFNRAVRRLLQQAGKSRLTALAVQKMKCIGRDIIDTKFHIIFNRLHRGEGIQTRHHRLQAYKWVNISDSHQNSAWLINIHVPIEEKGDKVKGNFCDNLRRLLVSLQRKNLQQGDAQRNNLWPQSWCIGKKRLMTYWFRNRHLFTFSIYPTHINAYIKEPPALDSFLIREFLSTKGEEGRSTSSMNPLSSPPGIKS